MNLKLLKPIAWLLISFVGVGGAHAGWAGRIFKSLSEYVHDVKSSKGLSLVVKQAKPKTDKFLYGHAFTKLVPPPSGAWGKAQKLYTYFPQLIAQTVIRKKNYKFTPVHSLAEDVLGLGLLDAPVERLTGRFTRPHRLTLLSKLSLSMPMFWWFYRYTDPDQIKKRQQLQSIEQHSDTLWHFVQHDFRGQTLKQMLRDDLISRNDSLQYAMQYMQALKKYYDDFDAQSSSTKNLSHYAQNPLFADTYSLLVGVDYIQLNGDDNTAIQAVCRKGKEERVEKIFQLTHLSLYQHRFLDAWLFDTEDKVALQQLSDARYQWYTLLNDFKSDPYVQALFKAHEQKALTTDELKYLLHQDVQDQFLWRVSKILKHTMGASLDELRQDILNDIYTRHRLS